MNLVRICSATLVAWLAIFAYPAFSGPFLETFDDGNLADGKPATWERYSAPFDRGDAAIQDGSLVITPPVDGRQVPGNPGVWETDVFTRAWLHHDIDILTQVRALTSFPTAIGINAMDDDMIDYPNGSGLYAVLVNDGQNRLLDLSYGVGSTNSNIGQVSTDLDLYANEINLRLTIRGRDVAFTAWPTDTPEPLPQIEGKLPAGLAKHQGYLGLYSMGRSTPAPAAFRYVQAVPEPASTTVLALSAGVILLCRKSKRRRGDQRLASFAR